MLPRRACGLVLVGLFSAFSQTVGQSASADPQVVLYHFLFFRAAWLQDQAASLVASGKPGSGLASLIQKQAGLTAQESAALTSIATDCRAQDQAILSQIRPLAAAAHGVSTPQLQLLAAQRLQNIVDHVGQLQTALGPTRFPVLDYYVHTTVVPSPIAPGKPAP